MYKVLTRLKLLNFWICCCAALMISCAKDTGAFYIGSLDINNPKIILASQQAGSMSLAMYDINGQFMQVLHDYVAQGNTPRGLAALSPLEFLISVDGNDHLDRYSLTSGLSTFVSDVNLTGNIFDIEKHAEYGVFVIETNTIEAFDLETGRRRLNPYIPATVGSCVLNTPRAMAFNQEGHLVVVNTGNDDINVYDVSDPSGPTCVRVNTTMGNFDPVTVLAHSDGFLYVGTLQNDRIYRFNGDASGAGTVIFDVISQVNNPTALAEMPDGSLLVASDGTNSIVNMSTEGEILSNTNFITDVYTNSVSDIIILQESTQ